MCVDVGTIILVKKEVFYGLFPLPPSFKWGPCPRGQQPVIYKKSTREFCLSPPLPVLCLHYRYEYLVNQISFTFGTGLWFKLLSYTACELYLGNTCTSINRLVNIMWTVSLGSRLHYASCACTCVCACTQKHTHKHTKCLMKSVFCDFWVICLKSGKYHILCDVVLRQCVIKLWPYT
jgi:hypothetical protein